MKQNLTTIRVVGSDGCWAEIDINEELLNHFKTTAEKATFIGGELVSCLEAMRLQRESRIKHDA